MKRIYDYHTGKLIKESANTLDKNRLYEGASFDVDIIENAKSVYRAQSNYNSRVLYLKKLVLSPSEKPIAIWEFTGNFCAREIEKICDAAGLDYCSVSAKTLRGSIKDIYDNEKFIIVDDFTYGQPGAVEDLIFDLVDLSRVTQVVCVGKISNNRNNDIFVDDLCTEFNNFVYSTADDTDDDNVAYESVSDKFAKYRKLYEAEDSDDDSSDEAGDGEGTENSDEEGKDKSKDGDDNSEDEDTEDVPMTAIVLTVKKDDVDKCKEELVDAGIPEDAITEVDTEDDDENGKLKVDADYALELKDYLKGKGIDLEEKIGGEIIDDSAEDSEEGKGEEGDDKSSEEGKGDAAVDFDSEFGDLFGDE